MTGSPESQAVLDPEPLEMLLEDVGPEVTARLVGIFLHETGNRLERISDALARDDHGLLFSECHSLSSGSATFGAMRLSKCALDIELACRDGDIDTAKARAAQLPGLAAPVIEALTNYIS